MADSTSGRVPIQIRWDPVVYVALQSAANATSTSINSFANTAVAAYIASPEISAKITAARAAQDEAIRKLAGD